MAPKKDNKRKSASSDNESDKDTKKDDTPKKTRQTTKDKTKDSKSKDTKKEAKEKPEKKEAEPITVARGEIDKVLEHLTGSLLKELLEGNNVKKAKTAQKKACIKEILELAGKKGQNLLFTSLEKEELKSALETLSKEELDHDNKSKMLAEVKNHFTTLGHKDFFKALHKDTLVKFAAALEFVEEDATKEELESALEEEILIAGLKQIFASMAKDFVVDVAKTLNIPHSGTKKALEERILSIAYPHLKEEEEEGGSDSGDKKKKKGEKSEGEKKVVTDINKINKDSTFEDLYQYYTKDLHDFADKHGLKKTGTKKELAHRILAWYKDPESKGVKPLKPGEGKKKRKKSEAQKKKEAKEKREKKKAEEGDKKDEKKDDKKDEKKDDKKSAKKDDKKEEKKDEKKDDKKDEKKTTKAKK